ncbi:MAG: OmpA family protein [Pseudomonadota bacterium]
MRGATPGHGPSFWGPIKAATVLVALAGTTQGGAAELPLPPAADLVVDSATEFESVSVPITPWQAGAVQRLRADGEVRRRVWQIPETGLSVAQITVPIRQAVSDAGFEILLDCAAAECGGFEFRFATDTLPAPEMHVDLGNYRFLSARANTTSGEDWLTVMVSTTDTRAFVQATEITVATIEAAVPVGQTSPTADHRARQRPSPDEPDEPIDPGEAVEPDLDGTLAESLDSRGRAVLNGLTFPSGSAQLGPEGRPSLTALAAYMAAQPEARIVLVGHTDAAGALPGNVDLSRRRAAAVRDALIEEFGIAPGRLSADGVGFLVPLTTNATPEGRERNRRVEAVLDLPG